MFIPWLHDDWCVYDSWSSLPPSFCCAKYGWYDLSANDFSWPVPSFSSQSNHGWNSASAFWTCVTRGHKSRHTIIVTTKVVCIASIHMMVFQNRGPKNSCCITWFITYKNGLRNTHILMGIEALHCTTKMETVLLGKVCSLFPPKSKIRRMIVSY